ncbi:MoaD/ThiS family protein [Pseudonocardia sp. RS11V-5]|uniref:MoaD/ThiS family protein n=1 Tax=Pseudonocardia terrae TaxID=2905831 RepID=UPI001E436AFF|nr:MoaD/ThiS family protein [Pseudonocardia terrae]MCE3550521.1 MoaD/ThiS family protein [Pseudonocardia terrae]
MSPVTTTTALRTVTVRYFAAAKSAAGLDAEAVEVPAGATVAALAEDLAERHGAEFARVLARCSYLVDEVAVRDPQRVLPDAAVVDVLPPFAGG